MLDALNRNEDCGGHFRTEYQTEDGEAQRNDEQYTYVAAWQFNGLDNDPTMHKEELIYENVQLAGCVHTNNQSIMNFKLRIWRQADSKSNGKLVEYSISDVNPDMSFLEMMDVLNDRLVKEGQEPVAFLTMTVARHLRYVLYVHQRPCPVR